MPETVIAIVKTFGKTLRPLKTNVAMNTHEKTKEEFQKELTELQIEFYNLNAIKDVDNGKRIKLEQELAVALQKIAFQNEEREQHAAELILALEKNTANKIEIDERIKELNGLYSLGILSEKFTEIEDVYTEFVNVPSLTDNLV